MSVLIRKCTIAEIESASTIAHILHEYAQEAAIDGLPDPLAKVATYKLLESTGAMLAFGAFVSEILVGYIIVLSDVLAHYSARVSIVESYFVLREYRKTGAGTKLRKAAEDYAKETKAVGILISAPLGGVLAEVLPNDGYKETNRVFFKKIINV